MPADVRKLGIEALKAGRFADAAKYLSGFISSAPADNDARLAFALALSGRGDHEKALIHLDKLLTKMPKSASLHFQRGTVLERANRTDQARREFRRALQLNPKHARAKAKLVPANMGFELVEEEPGYEVVEDEVVDAEEYVIDAPFTDDADNVIHAEEFEEIWADDNKRKLDLETIAKYCVLVAAVAGVTVFAFMTLSTGLAWILTSCAASGASLLIAADLLRRDGNTNALYWFAHIGGLVVIIVGIVAVMIVHRMDDNGSSTENEEAPVDYRSPDMKARFKRPRSAKPAIPIIEKQP